MEIKLPSLECGYYYSGLCTSDDHIFGGFDCPFDDIMKCPIHNPHTLWGGLVKT